MPHIIRGAFDGDGNFDWSDQANPRLRWYGTHAFVQWVQDTLCRDVGLNRTKLQQKRGTESWQLAVGGSRQVERVVDYVKGPPHIAMERKWREIERWRRGREKDRKAVA